jgi:hypothetical protein
LVVEVEQTGTAHTTLLEPMADVVVVASFILVEDRDYQVVQQLKLVVTMVVKRWLVVFILELAVVVWEVWGLDLLQQMVVTV